MDDDRPHNSFRTEIELIEYSAVNVGVALLTFSVTVRYHMKD